MRRVDWSPSKSVFMPSSLLKKGASQATVCHCFVEAVFFAENQAGSASAKQWHSLFHRATGLVDTLPAGRWAVFARWAVLAVAVVGWVAVAVSGVSAQQVTVSTPFNSLSDSFFERMGTNWGFNTGGVNFSFGGPNMALPQFGGFDPSAGIHSGWGVQRGGFNGFFNFAAGQGYRQSFVGQAPSVTLMNGQTGFISDTSQSPFVIGFVPVVGGYPVYPTINSPYSMMPPVYSLGNPGMNQMPGPAPGNPRVQGMLRRLQKPRRPANDLPEPPAVEPQVVVQPAPVNAAPPAARGDLNLAAAAPPAQVPAVPGPEAEVARAETSSAGRAVPSVDEARRLYQLEKASQNDDARVYFERGRTAEEDGKIGVAKIFYRMAATRATGEFRGQVQARLDAISSPGVPSPGE